MNIALKCPRCGGEIQVACSAGLEERTAECPHCHAKEKIGAFRPKLALRTEGVAYALRFGRQWVGRQADGSDAEVQIPDPSRFMSRKHALVELKCMAEGIRCTFEEHGTNPTSLQGIELMEDDIIVLNVNDCLTMGGRSMYLSGEFAETP